MASRTTTYSADQVKILFAGYTIESGFADGEFVSIEPKSPLFTSKAGVDGEVARARNNDARADVKVKLLQTSLGNNVLDALAKLDKATNGAGVGVLEVVDLSSGVVLAHGDKAWVSALPTQSRAGEITVNEWTLEVSQLVFNVHGNPSI